MLKTLILEILVSFAVLDALIDWLNWKRLPLVTEQDARTRSYQRENFVIGLYETGVQILFWAFVFNFPVLDWLDEKLADRIHNPIWQGAAWIAAISMMKSMVLLPFTWYSTFSIETRYGFNRTSLATFVLDRIKGLILALALGLPLLALVLHFFTAFGQQAWWLAWIAVTAISLGLSYLAPIVFLPLFNRFKPLGSGELRSAIEAYAARENFAMKGTFVMDGSRRSSKQNAFFAGFGRFRKLVLFDTLVEKHSVDELVAIVAHEMGHFKLGHIPKMIVISVATQGILFWGAGRFLAHPETPNWISDTLLLAEPTAAGALLLLSLLYVPVGRALSIATLALSRHHEYAADRYSHDTYGKPRELIQALSAMQKEHLSHPNPHPLKVWMDYSHPPVSQRAAALGIQPEPQAASSV
jgi:STE24 endopeptidase